MEPLNESVVVDTLIVGGGISGLSAAYHLQGNQRIMIVDEGDLPSAASLASTGMLVDSIEEDVCEIAERNPAFVQYVRAGIRDLLACIDAHSIPCDLTRTDALYLAAKPGHVPQLHAECEAKRALGDEATVLEGGELRRHIDIPACAALLLRNEHHFDAGAFCRGLANLLAYQGVRICPRTKVTRLDHGARIAEMGIYKVKYTNIIITAPLTDPTLDPICRNLIGVRSYVLASAEISASDFDAHWRQRGMFWTSEMPAYHYGKMDKDGRIVFGGGDAFVAGQPDPTEEFDALERQMRKVLPGFKDVPVEKRWSGVISFFPDRMPLVGQVSDGMFVALGTIGLPIGFRNGWLLNELMQGHTPQIAGVLSPSRKVPITRLHYLLLRHAPFAWVVNKYLEL